MLIQGNEAWLRGGCGWSPDPVSQRSHWYALVALEGFTAQTLTGRVFLITKGHLLCNYGGLMGAKQPDLDRIVRVRTEALMLFMFSPEVGPPGHLPPS